MINRPEWTKPEYSGPTPTLTEFLRYQKTDDFVFWSLSSGHHMNLLDEACEIIEELEKKIDRVQALVDDQFSEWETDPDLSNSERIYCKGYNAALEEVSKALGKETKK